MRVVTVEGDRDRVLHEHLAEVGHDEGGAVGEMTRSRRLLGRRRHQDLAAIEAAVPAAAVAGERYAPAQMAMLDSER